MANRSKTIRNTGSFEIREGKLLLYRVGPANAQRQQHNAVFRNMLTGEKERDREPNEYRKTPFHRGYWAFPYPFHDAFFYYHRYRQQLPKRLVDHRAADDEETILPDGFWDQQDAALKVIRKRMRPKLIWHPGPFYSHIKPKWAVGEQRWYRYDNAREWIEAARGHLWTWINGGRGDLFKLNYARDELEIFVPD